MKELNKTDWILIKSKHDILPFDSYTSELRHNLVNNEGRIQNGDKPSIDSLKFKGNPDLPEVDFISALEFGMKCNKQIL
jgi:hypothetical protein